MLSISWTMSSPKRHRQKAQKKNSTKTVQLHEQLKGASSTTGDDDGVDRSEVIRRHLSAGAGTPLYT